MPLVTASANERLWVQQEIGYAAALHVPVCPIAIGKLPSGMAEHIQGIHITDSGGEGAGLDETMGVIASRLSYAMVDDLVRRARLRRQGRCDSAIYWNERQELLVALAEAAGRSGCKLIQSRGASQEWDGRVSRLRQSAAFGSFSIPDVGVDSPDWGIRDPNRYRTRQERRLLRRERQAMEAYAHCFGCDLILDPRIGGGSAVTDASHAASAGAGEALAVSADQELRFKHSPVRTALRLKLLIDFIQTHQDNDRVRVVIPQRRGGITTNLTIVGDWFAAEAVVPYHGAGYERTMFTRHAPTVLNMIDSFDQDFRDHLRVGDLDPNLPATTQKAKIDAIDTLGEWLGRVEQQEQGTAEPR